MREIGKIQHLLLKHMNDFYKHTMKVYVFHANIHFILNGQQPESIVTCQVKAHRIECIGVSYPTFTEE